LSYTSIITTHTSSRNEPIRAHFALGTALIWGSSCIVQDWLDKFSMTCYNVLFANKERSIAAKI